MRVVSPSLLSFQGRQGLKKKKEEKKMDEDVWDPLEEEELDEEQLDNL